METKTKSDNLVIAKPTHGKESKQKTAETTNAEEKRAEKTQSLTEILEVQLKEIQRRKKLADNRSIFLGKLHELEESERLLNDEVAEGKFTSDSYVLRFGKRNAYREEENTFSINNSDLLLKFLANLKSEIKISIDRIENDLLHGVIG